MKRSKRSTLLGGGRVDWPTGSVVNNSKSDSASPDRSPRSVSRGECSVGTIDVQVAADRALPPHAAVGWDTGCVELAVADMRTSLSCFTVHSRRFRYVLCNRHGTSWLERAAVVRS